LSADETIISSMKFYSKFFIAWGFFVGKRFFFCRKLSKHPPQHLSKLLSKHLNLHPNTPTNIHPFCISLLRVEEWNAYAYEDRHSLSWPTTGHLYINDGLIIDAIAYYLALNNHQLVWWRNNYEATVSFPSHFPCVNKNSEGIMWRINSAHFTWYGTYSSFLLFVFGY
jgi:hypothetical protein